MASGLAPLNPPNTPPVEATGEPKVDEAWADTAPKPLCRGAAPPRDPNREPVPELAAGALPALPNPPPKPVLLGAVEPKPPPKELPWALLAPRLEVEPKVLPVLAAAPKVLVCPKPALPNEEAGLLAPNVDAVLLGAVPKVLVWPKPALPKEEVDALVEPKADAGWAPALEAPRPLVAPKPEVAPNLGAVLAPDGVPKPVLGAVAGFALPKVDVELEEPNREAGFTSAAGAAAALLANKEFPAAGLLLPTPHPPFTGEEPLKLTGVAGPEDWVCF